MKQISGTAFLIAPDEKPEADKTPHAILFTKAADKKYLDELYAWYMDTKQKMPIPTYSPALMLKEMSKTGANMSMFDVTTIEEGDSSIIGTVEVTLTKGQYEFAEIMDEEQDAELMAGAFGSSGGKTNVADKIIGMMPEHKVYVEGFAGGAAVYWHKKPSEKEIINDKFKAIANSYRFIKSHTPEDAETLKKELEGGHAISKEEFIKIRERLDSGNVGIEAKTLADLLKLNRNSFSNNKKDYCHKDGVKGFKILSRMKALKERLQGTKVESMDIIQLIEKYDSPQTFFYLDPPYPEEWAETKATPYSMDDFKALMKKLEGIKGKYMLSINDSKAVREIVEGDHRTIKKLKFRRTFRIGQESRKDSEYELLVANYPMDSSSDFKLWADEEMSDKELPDKIIIVKDFVSQAGSSVEGKSNPHDIDLIIRMDQKYDYFRRAIKENMKKNVAEVFNKELDFVFEPMGPFGPHRPLYHLALVRASHNAENESTDLSDVKGFVTQMKPGRRFYDIDSLLGWL